VLATYRYEAKMTEENFPQPFPVERPYYE
jgi:hypothetical protein